MNTYKLNKRRIRFKIKNLMKAKNVKIIKTSGITYIEASPKFFKEELDNHSLEELYNSFIRLGKELYIKNKDNINKIVFDSHNNLMLNLNNSFFNISSRCATNTEKKSLINEWLKDNNLSINNLYPNDRTVNVNTKMYKKGNLFMYKKRNEIVHLI